MAWDFNTVAAFAGTILTTFGVMFGKWVEKNIKDTNAQLEFINILCAENQELAERLDKLESSHENCRGKFAEVISICTQVTIEIGLITQFCNTLLLETKSKEMSALVVEQQSKLIQKSVARISEVLNHIQGGGLKQNENSVSASETL